MKIQMSQEVMVLAVNSDEGKENKKYYRVSIFDPVTGEAGQINCTEDVAKDVKSGALNTILFEYNDKYNSLRAIAVDKVTKK